MRYHRTLWPQLCLVLGLKTLSTADAKASCFAFTEGLYPRTYRAIPKYVVGRLFCKSSASAEVISDETFPIDFITEGHMPQRTNHNIKLTLSLDVGIYPHLVAAALPRTWPKNLVDCRR